MTYELSKSRFLAGLQCHRYLWWRVKEPEAPELVPDPAARLRFQQGTEVGEEARRRFPGGVLIDLPYWEDEARVRATREAMDAGAPAIYEATFVEEGVFVAVDVLARGERGGWRLVEVKSSLDPKEEHLPDAAVQAWVVGRAGVPVESVELMHLNRECVFPDLESLFVLEDFTEAVMDLLPQIPEAVRAQKAMLRGTLPQVEIGPHCSTPYECPFKDRCWPEPLPHGVETLYLGRGKREELQARGIRTLGEIPADVPLTPVQARQREAVLRGVLVVEGDLSVALGALAPRPLAFLDFETVSPFIPRWNGCRPHQGVPVQFSCHVLGSDGSVRHREWIASGPEDPRPPCARELAGLLEDLPVIAAWNASFEKNLIRGLAEAVPEYAAVLLAGSERVVDLLPIVRNHVYHPAFAGSFSLKAVLPALVPELGYEGLAIGDGSTASAELHRLLFGGAGSGPEGLETLRRDLMAYCAVDTLALVRVLEVLQGLAGENA